MRNGQRGRRASPRRLFIAATLTTLSVVGCDSGAATSTSGDTATATTAVATTSPELPAGLAGVAHHARAGLDGRLLQFRRDVAQRRVEIRLTAANEGLVVEGLSVRAPGLSLERVRPVEAELPEGLGVDLPVTMGDPDCSVVPGSAVAVVGLRDDSGERRTVEVPLVDDGLLTRLHAADCAEQALRAQADIRVAAVEPVQTRDGPALRLEIRLSRVAGSDPVRVLGTGPNTVYVIERVGPLPTLRGQDRVSLVVDMVPSRCDPHALGESYRTWLIDLVLALGDAEPRRITLTPDDDVRREGFAVETCRTAAD